MTTRITKASRRKQLIRHIQLNPARRLQLRILVIPQIRLLTRIRVLHHLPAITCQVGSVNNQRAHRALPRRLFKLVRPPPVVRQRLAAKELRIIRRRIAHDAEDHLALHIHTRIVIPSELRRRHPIPDEHNRRIHIHARRQRPIAHCVVIAIRQVDRMQLDPNTRSMLRQKRHRRLLRNCLHPHKVHLLQIGPVIPARLQPIQCKLRRNILRRQLAAPQPRPASLQQIVRQKPHMRPNLLPINSRLSRLQRRRNRLRHQHTRDRKQGHNSSHGKTILTQFDSP